MQQARGTIRVVGSGHAIFTINGLHFPKSQTVSMRQVRLVQTREVKGQGMQRQRCKRGPATDLMMLAVMYLHGGCINAGLKSGVVIRQLGNGESHG